MLSPSPLSYLDNVSTISTSNDDNMSPWFNSSEQAVGAGSSSGRDPTRTYRREIARMTTRFDLKTLPGGRYGGGGNTRGASASSTKSRVPLCTYGHGGSDGAYALAGSSSPILNSQVNTFLEQGWDGRINLGRGAVGGRCVSPARWSPSITWSVVSCF